MIGAGYKIHEGETSESFAVLQSADIEGRLLRTEVRVGPCGGAQAAPMHLHPKQEERYTLHEGYLCFYLNDEVQIYGPGETVIVPAGTPHTWRNATDSDARFTLEITPAGEGTPLFHLLHTLSQEGHPDESPLSRLLQRAVVLHRYPDQVYLAGTPVPVQKLLYRVISFVGRRMGYRADLSESPAAGHETGSVRSESALEWCGQTA